MNSSYDIDGGEELESASAQGRRFGSLLQPAVVGQTDGRGRVDGPVSSAVHIDAQRQTARLGVQHRAKGAHNGVCRGDLGVCSSA